jgi:hypothetical protein
MRSTAGLWSRSAADILLLLARDVNVP